MWCRHYQDEHLRARNVARIIVSSQGHLLRPLLTLPFRYSSSLFLFFLLLRGGGAVCGSFVLFFLPFCLLFPALRSFSSLLPLLSPFPFPFLFFFLGLLPLSTIPVHKQTGSWPCRYPEAWSWKAAAQPGPWDSSLASCKKSLLVSLLLMASSRCHEGGALDGLQTYLSLSLPNSIREVGPD